MADITGNTAPIGGGKSLWATTMCCHELEHSERFVVTDVPLILSAPPPGYWTVSDYCQEFVKFPVSVSRRLVVLSPEQASEFWRFLPAEAFSHISPEVFTEYGITFEENTWEHGTSRLLKLPNKPHDLFKEVPDFRFRTAIAENRRGCHYIIDEAHKKFPPMHYQRVGAQAEWYMSELRKLDDDLDWITQHPEKVDKNFRRNCTQWMQFQNMSRASLFMGVSLANRFRWHWYNQPELPTRTDKPTKSGWYTLDKKRRYHFLYKTMDGTGVSGGMLKESSMHKGRHPIIWVLAFVAIIVAAYLLPRVIEKAITVGVGGVAKGFQNGLHKAAGNMLPASTTNSPAPAPRPPSSYNLPPVRNPVAYQVRPQGMPGGIPSMGTDGGLYAVGVAVIPPNDLAVSMSDGSTLYRSKGEVQDVGSRYVKVLGMVLPIKANPPPFLVRQGENPAYN